MSEHTETMQMIKRSQECRAKKDGEDELWQRWQRLPDINKHFVFAWLYGGMARSTFAQWDCFSKIVREAIEKQEPIVREHEVADKAEQSVKP